MTRETLIYRNMIRIHWTVTPCLARIAWKKKSPQANYYLSTYLSFFFFSLPPLAFLSSLFLLVGQKRRKKNQHTTYTLFIVEGNYNKASEQSNARQTYSAANTIVQFLKLAIRRNFHLKLSKVRKRWKRKLLWHWHQKSFKLKRELKK